MWRACAHVSHMSKMVQIRNVPDALHRKLKSLGVVTGVKATPRLVYAEEG